MLGKLADYDPTLIALEIVKMLGYHAACVVNCETGVKSPLRGNMFSSPIHLFSASFFHDHTSREARKRENRQISDMFLGKST